MKKMFIIIISILSFSDTARSQVDSTLNREDGKQQHAALLDRLTRYYPEQFTDPEKKNRKTFSQFGYNLYYFSVPVFPITKFIQYGKFGFQSYGKPDRRIEKNGALYTCRGGFVDFSHMRAGINWTVHLTFALLKAEGKITMPREAASLELRYRDTEHLDIEDIAAIAQNIAFERLLWHEVASWYFHKPYHKVSEQASAFSPEDLYSNMLGTQIGKQVALRLLRDSNRLSYARVATEEIQKMITTLKPVESNKESRAAYDIIDLNKQRRLVAGVRNEDVWYDSRIVFRDQRYAFKRYTCIGPEIAPWLVPQCELLGCAAEASPEVLLLPKYTKAGSPLYDHYDFRITPDSSLFYDYKNNRQLHPPLGAFVTADFGDIMKRINSEMALKLGPGFNERDCMDPTVYYTNAQRVLLK